MAKLTVEVWSDIVCPWCYIGKRRLEAAMSRLEGGEVALTWRSFELDPSAPVRQEVSLTEMLSRKYGMSAAQARQMQAQVTQVAAQDGLAFSLDQAQGGNTFAAHRLLQRAQEVGRGDAMKERLMRAYFTEGLPISDAETLAQLAQEVGLDAADVAAARQEARYAAQVRADEQQAQQFGIRGVPFFVIAGKYGVSGAQPAEVLLGALQQALNEQAPLPRDTEGPAPSCDDEGCEIPS